MQKLLLLFKALSEETRLKIISILREGELCVCDIAETLGMTQPNISFHIGLLKETGLIKDRKSGRCIYYSLDESEMFGWFMLMSIFERMKDCPVYTIKKSRKC